MEFAFGRSVFHPTVWTYSYGGADLEVCLRHWVKSPEDEVLVELFTEVTGNDMSMGVSWGFMHRQWSTKLV